MIAFVPDWSRWFLVTFRVPAPWPLLPLSIMFVFEPYSVQRIAVLPCPLVPGCSVKSICFNWLCSSIWPANSQYRAYENFPVICDGMQLHHRCLSRDDPSVRSESKYTKFYTFLKSYCISELGKYLTLSTSIIFVFTTLMCKPSCSIVHFTSLFNFRKACLVM